MNGRIGVERVFNLGEYKSLRVIEEVNEIPEEVVQDPEMMDQLRAIILIDVDLTYQRYYAQTQKLAQYHDGSTEKTNALLEIRATAFDKLIKLANG